MADFQLRARVTWAPRSDIGQFISTRITPAVRQATRDACDALVEEAKTLCPVDTGALRDSIKADVADGDRTVVGTVSANTSYASYVEYGTGIRGASSVGAGPYPYSPNWPGMPAQPFMRPAADTSRDMIKERYKSALTVAMQK